MSRIFGPEWNYFTSNRDVNFHGAVKMFFEQINTDVKEYIKDNYYRCYINIIFPMVRQDIALIDYSYDYLEKILDQIKNDRDLLDQTIKSDYRHLIIDPYEYYINSVSEKTGDLSYGMSYKLSVAEDQDLNEVLLLIPKSFSLKEEEKASKFFLSSFEAHGGIVGLAVMFFVGVRENEACGLCFKDIKEMKRHPGTYYLDVGYETTKINSNDLKGGGKTRNAPRRLVLLPEQYEFLKKRMEHVEHQIGSSCLDLPIVCRGDRFDVRCSTIDLSVEGRRFFKNDMKMRESEIAATSTEMVLNDDGEFYEEDPTTYFLRRNAATRLYVHDLSIEECQYFMGHDIESARFLRSDFSDEDMLYSIYQKLMKDPFSDNCTL